MMGTSGQWGYWAMQIAGGVLALFLLYRGLLRDRSNGRPRCPRCGYDRTGATGPTCPECGHAVRWDKDLYRTRRHWRSVIAAGLVVVCMWYAGEVRHRIIQVKEPVRSALVPTTWKILTVMSLDNPIDQHLGNRFFHRPPGTQRATLPNHFWAWQEWLLAHLLRRRAVAIERASPRTEANWLGTLAARRGPAVDALIELSQHSDSRVRAIAIVGLGNAKWACPRVWPAVRAGLEDPAMEIRQGSMAAISRLGSVQFQNMSDEELGGVLRLLTSGHARWNGASARDLYLNEVLRRGTPALIPELEKLIDSLPTQPDSLGPASNIELIATLRRLQGRPDPLVIEVVTAMPIRCAGQTLPTVAVCLRPHADEQRPLIFQFGGDSRGSRPERWHVEVRDARGALVHRLKESSNFGGLFSYGVMDPREAYSIDLDLSRYIEPLPPGEYQVTIAYHNDTQISYAHDLSGYIVTESAPITLIVDPVADPTP